MILYNQELGEQECEFNISETTQKYLVSFFGFYPHNISHDFNNFLRELEFKDIIDKEDKLVNFKLDGDWGLEAYAVYDRRTFDVAIILPKTFSSEQEALDWFNKKVKDSDYIKKSEIDEIDVLDGEKLLPFLNKIIDYKSKVKNIDQAFKQNIKDLKKQMLDNYSQDPAYKEIIKEKFRNLDS